MLRRVLLRSRILTALGLWLLALTLIANRPFSTLIDSAPEEEREGHEDAKKEAEEKLKEEAREDVLPALRISLAEPAVQHVLPSVARPADAPHQDPARLSVRRLL